MGLAGLLLTRRLVPDLRADQPRGLDWRGFLLTAVGVAALVIGLEQVDAGRPSLGDPLGAALGLGDNPAVAYRIAFVFLAAILLAPFIEAVTMPASTGSVVTGRR